MHRLVIPFLVALALAAAAAAAATAPAAEPTASARHCRPGTTPATIAGRHVCLLAGAPCARRHDRAYHRYRFHCHTGRLARFPTPAPPPGKPPTLPDPPPPAGLLVDVGGYRLHLECVGAGEPTIVIETGQMATRLNYRRVQYALGREYRVCTYDRPGTTAPVPSASDPRPRSVQPTGETFARELHAVLANGGVPGPYLLAGTSLGGLLISAFTARYPDEVAGLVFIDAIAPGSVGLWLPMLNGSLEPWDGSGDVALLNGLSFGERPVVALATQSPGELPDLRRRGSNVVAAQAPYGHLVFLEAPGLAYEAIRVAAAAVRGGGRLPPCAQTSLPRIGAHCVP